MNYYRQGKEIMLQFIYGIQVQVLGRTWFTKDSSNQNTLLALKFEVVFILAFKVSKFSFGPYMFDSIFILAP